MKHKISILFTLLMLCWPWWNAVAEERNFPAGSLVIPMDSFYQPDNDGGILEAYGMVYYLLSHRDAYGEPDITVYWIINQEKVDIKDPDFIIEDNTLTAGEVVAKLYDHAGGTSGLTFNAGDDFQRITYSGGPWIVDATDVEKARSIIDQSPWSAVELHTAQVPFKAPVYRTLLGTPPKIALMNNGEDKTKGNAAILEAYLRLAGICTNVYEVLTPNEIIFDNALITGDYDFLWAPHWTGYDKYQADNNSNGTPDVEDIVKQVRLYLDNGKGLLAECASIEVFEHSQNGRFLSTSGFGHNGGTNDPSTIIYNDTGTANSQVGDYFYAPEGGHLHNWRPFVFGDNYQLADRPDQTPAGNPEVTAGNPSTYQSSDTNLLTRFTIDNTGWDYYVGGYADGDKKKGYVVYLGGHKYASCGKGSDVDPEPNVHTIDFEFSKEISNEIFTLLVKYNSGLSTSISFDKNDLNTHAGDPTDVLQIDLTSAEIDKKKLKGVIFRNNSTGIVTIDSVTFSWSGGDTAQQFKKITDKKTDIKHYDKPEVGSGVELSMTDFTIDTASVDTSVGGCTNNDDCSWKNIAGVRYVLNTLFNISYQISSREFIRAAPVVDHPYLYQGSFEYPSFRGHFRRYDVTLTDAQTPQWDTADNGIPSPLIRNVVTAKQNADGTWSKVAFAAANIEDLRIPLNVTPANNDDSDELDVITRLRGYRWNSYAGEWVELPNKLGGIMHSAPVIVGDKDHISHSTEVAYVGDLYGMLHAIETATGIEKWAYIPQNLLGKLQNDRTDPNSAQNFAAVDGSPTAKDILYDHDNDPGTADEWRTILSSAEGFGGTHIFALDITDPDNWSILWEATDTAEPGGGMGHSYITAIGKVKSPIKDVNDEDGDGDFDEIIGYEPKWMIFVSTGYRSIATDHGGINIFAFDLKTGAKVWRFSSEYADSVNDIPGAVTLFDMDDDSFVDRVYAGDMNGRLWELNALDGTNPNGIDTSDPGLRQIPLYNAGIGYPISVSPAVSKLGGHTILAFGTGGTDWAANDRAYAIFVVDATEKQALPTYAGGAGTLLWKYDLNVGEKVWSAPTIAAGFLFVATTYGSLESTDPSNDIPAAGEPSGDFLKLKILDGTMVDSITNIGKVRGSIYVDRQHAYLTTIDGKVIQIGEGNFDPGSGTNVVLKTWRQLSAP